jgi:hypothetical protein
MRHQSKNGRIMIKVVKVRELYIMNLEVMVHLLPKLLCQQMTSMLWIMLGETSTYRDGIIDWVI